MFYTIPSSQLRLFYLFYIYFLFNLWDLFHFYAMLRHYFDNSFDITQYVKVKSPTWSWGSRRASTQWRTKLVVVVGVDWHRLMLASRRVVVGACLPSSMLSMMVMMPVVGAAHWGCWGCCQLCGDSRWSSRGGSRREESRRSPWPSGGDQWIECSYYTYIEHRNLKWTTGVINFVSDKAFYFMKAFYFCQ
jgi:hypothetical protein